MTRNIIIKQSPWFCSISDANKITGLSCNMLRSGAKSGNILSIKAGDKYLINMPALAGKYGIPLDICVAS